MAWICGNESRVELIGIVLLGYLSSVTRHGLVRLPPVQRFSMELANYRSLIAKDMREVEVRVRFSRLQTRGFSFYISISECPPNVDECLEYYDS